MAGITNTIDSNIKINSNNTPKYDSQPVDTQSQIIISNNTNDTFVEEYDFDLENDKVVNNNADIYSGTSPANSSGQVPQTQKGQDLQSGVSNQPVDSNNQEEYNSETSGDTNTENAQGQPQETNIDPNSGTQQPQDTSNQTKKPENQSQDNEQSDKSSEQTKNAWNQAANALPNIAGRLAQELGKYANSTSFQPSSTGATTSGSSGDSPNIDVPDNYIDRTDLNLGLNLDELLQYFYLNGNDYGIDQGVLTNLKDEDPDYYNYLKDKMVNVYNFYESDVAKIFSLVDSIGACSYARSVNVVFEYFKDKPELFESLFGFPLYRETSEGNIAINDGELLLDLYYWGNKIYDKHELFTTDENGKTILDDPDKWVLDNGKRYWPQRGSGYNELNNYLQYKSSNLNTTTTNILSDEEFTSSEDLRATIESHINNGEILSMGICAQGDNRAAFTILNNKGEVEEVFAFSANHWVKITGVNDEGVIVSSWGTKCIIPYDQFNPNNAYFNILSDVINYETQ